VDVVQESAGMLVFVVGIDHVDVRLVAQSVLGLEQKAVGVPDGLAVDPLEIAGLGVLPRRFPEQVLTVAVQGIDDRAGEDVRRQRCGQHGGTQGETDRAESQCAEPSVVSHK
jgi:hypothetical protein